MSDDEKTRVLSARQLASLPPRATVPAAEAGEQRTRVVSGKPAAGTTSRISFTCPNGHTVLAAVSLAGKRGKCSKCGADVQIPGAAAPALAAPASSDPPVSAGAGPEASSESGGQPPGEALPQLPADGAADRREEHPPPGEASGEQQPGWDFVGVPATGDGSDVAPGGDWSVADPADLFDEDGGNPTARLVARLWAESEQQPGGVIELHLAGGGVVFPKWYDAQWSRGTHGLFASEAADGSITLTAVAWDTVHKVIVRQLSEVPPDMFP